MAAAPPVSNGSPANENRVHGFHSVGTLVRRGDALLDNRIRMDPVKIRVALPAADPPEYAAQDTARS